MTDNIIDENGATDKETDDDAQTLLGTPVNVPDGKNV